MEDIINRRCGWAGTDELYTKYHDEEWGKLVTDDKTYLNLWYSKALRQDYPGSLFSENAKDTEKPFVILT